MATLYCIGTNRAALLASRPSPGRGRQARLMVRTTISARDIDGLDQVHDRTDSQSLVAFRIRTRRRSPNNSTSLVRDWERRLRVERARPECANCGHPGPLGRIGACSTRKPTFKRSVRSTGGKRRESGLRPECRPAPDKGKGQGPLRRPVTREGHREPPRQPAASLFIRRRPPRLVVEHWTPAVLDNKASGPSKWLNGRGLDASR